MPLSCGSDGKESACNEGDLGLIPGLGGTPGGGHGKPLQYSCLENPLKQRRLMGYSPWGHKESDMTERLSTHICMKWFIQDPDYSKKLSRALLLENLLKLICLKNIK